MVYESVTYLFRKLKRNKTINKDVENDEKDQGKPPHRWQRRKRQEEQAERKRQELVTQNKVHPWFQSCSNSRGQFATVIYAFSGEVEGGALSCEVGDSLVIESADHSDAWWQALNTRTGETGYIPANFVTEEPGIDGVLDAWHDIDRRASEAKLRKTGLPNGTYILRPSSNDLRVSLSVLSIVGDTKTIKHYRIMDDNAVGGFFITPTQSFVSLEALIRYYKAKHDQQLELLTTPLPRILPAVQMRNFEIQPDKVKLKTCLTENGRFGSVHLASMLPLKQTVVIKKFAAKITPKHVINVVKSCHRLHHPCIVHVLGMCSEPPMLALEYMPGGSLKDLLVKDGPSLDYAELQHFLYQVVDGMDYLENMLTHHGDLRSSTVLLSSERIAKISGFGLNKFCQKFKHDADAVRWAAPESINGSSDYNIRCDAWSFGVLMFEVFTLGSLPYKGMKKDEIFMKVATGYRLPNPETMNFKCDRKMYESMRDLWNYDAAFRPTFRELWFTFEECLCHNDGVYAEIE